MGLRTWNSVGRETLGWIGRVEKPSGGSARSRGLRAAWLGWKTFGWTSQVVKPSGGSARSQSLRAAWPGWKAFGWTSQVGKPSGRLTGEASGVFSGARCNDPVSEHLSPLTYFGPPPPAAFPLHCCGANANRPAPGTRSVFGCRAVSVRSTRSRVSAPVPLL